VLDRVIVDKEAWIGPRARVGVGDDLRPNRDEPERLYAGITLVGKRARVPRGVEIGRNCRIDPDAIERDFARRRQVRSGETISAGIAAT
jgi:glucose-1-phosphate adenylyltransferase